jgi:hypothetical protein
MELDAIERDLLFPYPSAGCGDHHAACGGQSLFAAADPLDLDLVPDLFALLDAEASEATAAARLTPVGSEASAGGSGVAGHGGAASPRAGSGEVSSSSGSFLPRFHAVVTTAGAPVAAAQGLALAPSMSSPAAPQEAPPMMMMMPCMQAPMPAGLFPMHMPAAAPAFFQQQQHHDDASASKRGAAASPSLSSADTGVSAGAVTGAAAAVAVAAAFSTITPAASMAAPAPAAPAGAAAKQQQTPAHPPRAAAAKRRRPAAAAAAPTDSDSDASLGGSDDDDSDDDGAGDANPRPSKMTKAQLAAARRRAPEVDWRAIADPAERRRQRRLAKNRVTAARSRERKKEQWGEMAARLDAMEADNARLRAQLAALADENGALKRQLASSFRGASPAAEAPRVSPAGPPAVAAAADEDPRSCHEPAVLRCLAILHLVVFLVVQSVAAAAVAALASERLAAGAVSLVLQAVSAARLGGVCDGASDGGAAAGGGKGTRAGNGNSSSNYNTKAAVAAAAKDSAATTKARSHVRLRACWGEGASHLHQPSLLLAAAAA